MASIPLKPHTENIIDYVKNERGEWVHQPSPDLHSNWIRGESGVAKDIKENLDHIMRLLAQTNDSYIKQSSDLRSTVKANQIYMTKDVDHMLGISKAEVKRLESNLADKANFKPKTELAGIIAGTLQTATPAERSQIIDQLLAEKDGPTLATLYSISTALTKLTKEQKQIIPDSLFRLTDPYTFKQLEDARFNENRVQMATNRCVMYGAAFDRATSVNVAKSNSEPVRTVLSQQNL